MKKTKYIIFWGTLIIPSLFTLAVEPNTFLEKKIDLNLIEQVKGIKEATQAIKKVEDQMSITSEEIQKEFSIEEHQILEYLNIDAKQNISYGKIAKWLCQYIGRAPISLPEQYGGKSGYIGRLVLEGIWGDLTLDDNLVVTREDFIELAKRVSAYREDSNLYIQEFVKSLEKEKGELIGYRLQEKQLGQLEDLILGQALKAQTILKYGEYIMPLYTYLDEFYILDEHIKFLKLEESILDDDLYISKSQKMIETSVESSSDKLEVCFNLKDVYIENIRSYTLDTKEGILIPLEALSVYYDKIEAEQEILLVDQLEGTSHYLEVNKDFITNQTEEVLQVQLSNLYWDGKEIVEEKWDIDRLKSKEAYPNHNKVYTLNQNKVYLTTLVNKIKKGEEILWDTSSDYGQANHRLFRKYEAKKIEAKRQKEKEENKNLFPPSIIIGTINYDVGPFKKGDQVEVYRADDGIRYYVYDNQKIVKIPWNSISIPKNPRVETKTATIEQLEEYINEIGLTSQTNYLVWTDLYRQKTYIFSRKDERWQVLKAKITKTDTEERYAILVCSTGHNITPTPRGIFQLKAHVPYFGVDKGYRCKTAVQISGDYLYHSLIFDENGNYLLEGKGVLGQRASQGCIRFSPEESEWFYNTLPLRTTVWIN